jgi:two-component system nitrogen regulation response regulator NtrX
MKKKPVEAEPVPSSITGASPAVEKVREWIQQAASTDSRLLISGENGTGKELAAREIHRLSPRRNKPFVAVNCAAIPDTLIESELFGHERGAFTGAVSSRKGKFESASGGSLFLDEAADLSSHAQAKLLRAIQEGRVERLGSDQSIDVDVRIIAATNKNLEAECRAGRFREDLFFRLNVIPLVMPSLRERNGDVLLLLDTFLGEQGMELHFSGEAKSFLSAYGWPGNIRELRNLAERIAVLYRPRKGKSMDAAELKELLLLKAKAPSFEDIYFPELIRDLQNSLDMEYTEAKVVYEGLYLKHQLGKNSGLPAKSAESTGLSPGSLAAKLKKQGISASAEHSNVNRKKL